MATPKQLEIAILWLEGNEGDAEERGACLAAAKVLEGERERIVLRDMARAYSVPIPVMRRALKRAGKPV